MLELLQVAGITGAFYLIWVGVRFLTKNIRRIE